MDNEWGPWIEHDGKGCPCVGAMVHVVLGDSFDPSEVPVLESEGGWEPGYMPLSPSEAVGIARHGGSWSWVDGYYPVITFRVRKPRGLTILEELLQGLPAPVRPKVDP